MRIDLFRAVTILSLLVAATAALAADKNPAAARLLAARSLRCTFDSAAITTWKAGRKTIANQSFIEPSVTYDNLDRTNHTGRIIGNAGAANVSIETDVTGALWIVEHTPGGLYNVTTVFPAYAVGTTDFIILESRHSGIGDSVLGQLSSGTCVVLE